MKNKNINSDFYKKDGEYNKSFFDLCKVFLHDNSNSCIIFNDAKWDNKSFLEAYSKDERYLGFLRRRKKKEIRRKVEEDRRNEIEKLISNIVWMQEYIFQESKYNEITTQAGNLFKDLEKLRDRFDNYFKKSPIEKENLIKKRDNLINKGFGILKLNQDDFIQFISDKKGGVFAQEILNQALLDRRISGK